MLEPVELFDTAITSPDHAGGICWTGTSFWAVAYVGGYGVSPRSIAYNYDYQGNLLGSFQLQGNSMHGCAWDGSYLWVGSSSLDSGCYVWRMRTDGTWVSRWVAPGGAYSPNPYGYAWDGSNIWIYESETNKIYQCHPDTGAVISSFSSGVNTDIHGIYWDASDSTIWALADKIGKLYQYTTTGTVLKIIDIMANDNWRGLTRVNNRWHVTHRYDFKIYKFVPSVSGVVVYTKVNGKWRQSNAYVKVDGSWRPVIDGWVKDNGVWKKLMG